MDNSIEQLAETFARAAGTHRLVWTERLYLADCDTPFALFSRLRHKHQTAFLLESVEGGETWARYSFMGLDRLIEVVGYADRVEVHGLGAEPEILGPGLEQLRRLTKKIRPQGLSLPERFSGGLVGYIAYDVIREFERIPERHRDPAARLFRFIVPRVLCIYDNFRQNLRLVGFDSAELLSTDDAVGAAEALETRLDQVETRLTADSPIELTRCERYPLHQSSSDVTVHSNFARGDFLAAVERAKEYILAGDIFQVVLSQRLSAGNVSLSPLAIYRRLRHDNPSPYLFILDFEDETLIGSSPEVMVRLTGRRAEVRPIAGTRPRGATPSKDAALEVELLSDPKERAEHVMLLDLGRNDLGRVCDIGSIEIPERMVVERYSKVMHIVSHVQGQLKQDLDWLDLLGATFPAGTLSGAPKIRAMEIIDELEPSRRRLYGGAIGYIGFDGNMDLCITIRTLHARNGEYIVQAGAGIVADSVPEREYDETLNKAQALVRALGGGELSENPPELISS